MNDDIRFNVYGAKGQSIYPLYTSNKICDRTCNLFESKMIIKIIMFGLKASIN